MGEGFCPIDPPVTHRTLWIDADALLEGAKGFIVPKVVQQVQSLVKPYLCLRRGRDTNVGISNAR